MARPSSCSRNAHGKTVLVRRAQSRINHATLPEEPAYRPGGENERAWREQLYSVNAARMVLCSRSARPEKGLARRAQLDQRGCHSPWKRRARFERLYVGRSMRACMMGPIQATLKHVAFTSNLKLL